MKRVIINTQAELDALPASFAEYTVIEIRGGTSSIIVNKAQGSSHVVARDSSHVEAWDSSHVEAWDSSRVVARGSSHVVARGSSHVVAQGSSHVVAWDSSHVVARDSSHVVAWDSSHVEAWDSSHVEAWDSSRVVARGSSHVVARGSSHVVAQGSSHVVARDSSHVVAWDSSHVVARDSSHVEAWDSSAVHNHSTGTSLELFGFAVAILVAKSAKLKRGGSTALAVTPTPSKGVKGWIDAHGIANDHGRVVIYKRVSSEYKTREGESNETLWSIGSTLDHPSWAPEAEECGEGKFHACAQPYFCDEFRDKGGDRYIAIQVSVEDLYAWDGGVYPHKIAFRKGVVLYECDRFGNKEEVAS